MKTPRRDGARLFRLLLWVALLPAMAACAAAPEMRYYRIVTAPPAPAPSAAPITLGVARVRAAEPYRQERILYRRSPYRVEHYPLDRWEAPPVEMVQDALLRSLRGSGRFHRVVQGRAGTADPLLEVRLVRFEEVDEAAAWSGLVELEYELLRGAQSLLRETSRRQVPADGRTVESVAIALSQALEAALAEIVAQTATALR